MPTSSASHLSGAVTAVSAFSNPVKLEAVRACGKKCYVCETRSPDFAHMVSQRDNQVRVWQSANLLPFRINSELNCVPLCPTCHMYFGRASDPGLVILPYDLEFFISYEERDRINRASPSQRRVPTIENYKEHLRSKHSLGPNAKGGLFKTFFLEDYLFGGLATIDYYARFSAPKVWQGHPHAAIRRGIAVLGSARFHALPKEVSDQLLKLRNLYFEDDELVSPKLLQLQHKGQKSKRKLDDESDHDDDEEGDSDGGGDGDGGDGHGADNDQEPPKKGRKLGQSQAKTTQAKSSTRGRGRGRGSRGDRGKQTSYLRSSDEQGWTLGPASTSDDAVRRYRPVILSQ